MLLEKLLDNLLKMEELKERAIRVRQPQKNSIVYKVSYQKWKKEQNYGYDSFNFNTNILFVYFKRL